jgi:signal transduction histidine kinase
MAPLGGSYVDSLGQPTVSSLIVSEPFENGGHGSPDEQPRPPRVSDPAGLRFISDAGLIENTGTTPVPTLDRIARLAALATHAPIAQINLITEEEQIPVAVFLDPEKTSETDRAPDAIWRRTISLHAAYYQPGATDIGPVAVEDTRTNALTRDARGIAFENVRSYAAARLVTPTGAVLGTVCVMAFAPRAWSPSDLAVLGECAALAGEELASHVSHVEAERSREVAERAQSDAEAASRAKSEFLAVMSHELRTPLNAIGGYAELLEMGIRGPISTQQREDLRRIQLSQRHLLTLINEVLNYTSLEQGTTRFDLTRVGVRDALVEAEGVIAPQVRAKVLFLSLGDVRRDLAVVADVEKVREILTALLSNAVKFTDAGGRIDVTCQATPDTVRIRVRDTGVGIAPDNLEMIFEPFVQIRDDLTRTGEGAGLGLAISRALARGQGGDLTVESTVGAGSTFTLTLPRATTSG